MNKESQILKEFKVVTYQQDYIILTHLKTKKVYRLFQRTPPIPQRVLPNIQNSILMRPIITNKGLIYLKSPRTLESEVVNRKKAHNVINYSQQQILNTFQPILECIKWIHSNNVIHGNITKESIIFGEKGDIKLRDWLLNINQNPYYQKNKLNTKLDDLKAIGLIILETACLKDIKEVLKLNFQQLLQYSYNEYSKQFIFFVISLIKDFKIAEPLTQMVIKEQKLSIQNYKNNSYSQSPEDNEIDQLQEIYKNMKKLYESRKRTPMKNTCHNFMTNPNQISPSKKFMITTSTAKKSGFKLQECENKKTLTNEDVKKKHIEKITKIIQRSNAFVNQLMTRRAGDTTKKINTKTSISFHGIENTNLKKLSKQPIMTSRQGSPSKRLRVIQKKK